jgi:hypothetical protein
MIEQQCRVGFRLFRTILFGSAAVFWGAPVVGRGWAHHSRDSRKVRLSRRPETERSRRRRLLGGRSEKREGKADPVRAGGSSALEKEGTENTRPIGRGVLSSQYSYHWSFCTPSIVQMNSLASIARHVRTISNSVVAEEANARSARSRRSGVLR